MRVLQLLVSRAGEVVAREEIRECLWGESTFVDFERGINFSINQIRAALCDSPEEPRYVETLPRLGYRFVGTVYPSAAGAKDQKAEREGVRPFLLSPEHSSRTHGSVYGAVIWISRSRHRTIVLAVILAGLLLGGVLLVNHPSRVPFRDFTIAQITDTGRVEVAAISPDGKYVLHVQNDNELRSIWLRNVATGSNTQVQPPTSAFYRSIQFSPDGNYIYFLKASSGLKTAFDLYRAPVLGGIPQTVVRNIDTDVGVSPDGRRLAYARDNIPEPQKWRLLVSNPDGSAEQVLQVSSFDHGGPNSVAWSPDGNYIAYGLSPGSGGLSGIEILDLRERQAHTLARYKELVGEVHWAPDENSLLVLFADGVPNSFRGQVGVITYPEGKLLPITRDTNRHLGLTISADGKILSVVQAKVANRLDVFERQPVELSMTSTFHYRSGDARAFEWSSDGSLWISDGARLVHVAADGSEDATLAQDSKAVIRNFARCGERYLVLTWGGHGSGFQNRIWRVNLDGSNEQLLGEGRVPVCSPDGKWVYYIQRTETNQPIARVPVEGGRAETVPGSRLPGVMGAATNVAISPDGKELYFVASTFDPAAPSKLVVVDLQGESRQLVRILDVNPAIAASPDATYLSMRLTPDGRALAYPIIQDGVANLWAQPLDGSPGRLLTHFAAEQIADFRWSRDGKKLAVLHRSTSSDAILLREKEN